jgi:prepilin-type N-terminal cleavage/methylation domain-containing protein
MLVVPAEPSQIGGLSDRRNRMRTQRQDFISPRRNLAGFTLAEVVIALAISALLFAGLVLGFIESSRRAQWSADNLAAQSLALQGLEQARAAQWDPLAQTPIDNCVQSNFPPVTTNILDVPISGGNTNNYIYATNTWTITTINTNITGNNVSYPSKMIRVDCTWLFKSGARTTLFTNTVSTLRAPDQ